VSYNDITGKAIKTGIQNKAYDEGWERIFAKKTAHEWLETMPDIRLLDPDGWRWNDGVTLDTPIKWSDFNNRLNHSTICGSVLV
jgi:hypothetical protein